MVAIPDGSGTAVVQYAYEAWGGMVSTDGSLSSTLGFYNPLRYRGYVYDAETTHYYLQSRYYYPYLCRFLNADAYTSTGQGLLGNNMFAYCLNNPIVFGDPCGNDAIILYDENTFGHIGIIVQDENGVWWHFYWGTVGGFWGNILRVLAFCGHSVKEYTWCVEYSGDITLSGINDSNQYGGDYEDWHYLEGDFSQCVQEMKEPEEQYNLYSRNCSQISLWILSRADTEYQETLLQASGFMLPARSFSYICRNINETTSVYFENRCLALY